MSLYRASCQGFNKTRKRLPIGHRVVCALGEGRLKAHGLDEPCVNSFFFSIRDISQRFDAEFFWCPFSYKTASPECVLGSLRLAEKVSDCKESA